VRVKTHRKIARARKNTTEKLHVRVKTKKDTKNTQKIRKKDI
jgi:hypothetical protein